MLLEFTLNQPLGSQIYCVDRYSHILMFLNTECDVNCWKSQNIPSCIHITQPTGRDLSASESQSNRP